MTGRPKIGNSAPCSGSWACDGLSHCACYWDTPAHRVAVCCTCGKVPPDGRTPPAELEADTERDDALELEQLDRVRREEAADRAIEWAELDLPPLGGGAR